MSRKLAHIALLFLCLAATVARAGGRSEAPLEVAAVQFRVEAALLRSPDTYESALRFAATTATAGRRVDLIVFPEYTAAFFALALAGDQLARSSGADQLLAGMHAAEPAVSTPADFFASRAPAAEAWIREVFATIARDHHAWVVAGTWFAPDGSAGLRNRALVFGPDGALVYTQDKVFLTDIEIELLHMSPGSMEAATGVHIRDTDVRLTICRDTFDPGWEARNRGADLWIDIKANGAAFDQGERESFGRALPARLGRSGVPWGLTVCLTGSLLEFFWEGESSFIATGSDGVRKLWASRSPSAAESTVVSIPRSRDRRHAGP
jgi:predicted amidohydrolase